jgi:hypothetical protein
MSDVKTVTIERAEKKYVFNPEQITNGQYEAIEKEMMAAGIDERMTRLLATLQEKKYQLPTVTPEQQKQFLAETYHPEDGSEEAKLALQYRLQTAKRGIEIMRAYVDCHALLLKSGGRPKLVAVMLVPEGSVFTDATYREVLNDLVPRLKREEVDMILANFLPSRIWSLNSFPNYFSGETSSQSQEAS